MPARLTACYGTLLAGYHYLKTLRTFAQHGLDNHLTFSFCIPPPFYADFGEGA